MTLKEAIKKNKLEKRDSEIYISMHNKDGKRFYGTFISDTENLKDYYDMNITKLEPINANQTIYTADFPEYSYLLGLNSMRIQWEKEQTSKVAREKRETLTETTKRRRKK